MERADSVPTVSSNTFLRVLFHFISRFTSFCFQRRQGAPYNSVNKNTFYLIVICPQDDCLPAVPNLRRDALWRRQKLGKK
jgi:hypothetical protein